jgi:hypothetical protein
MQITETTVGERFARAFLAKDWNGVATLLDPHVDFRGLTDFVCEQTAYYDTDGERIIKLRVLCSGFLPAAERG